MGDNNTKKSSWPSLILRVVLSVGLLSYLFFKIDWDQTITTIKSADLGLLLLAGGIFVLLNGVIVLRWLIFIRALDLKVPLAQVVRYFLIGLFGNLFLPSAVGGDVIKIIGLCKHSDQKPRVVASVLLDRLSGFAGVVIMAVVAYLIGQKFFEDQTLLIPILGLGGISLVAVLVLFVERLYEFGCRIFNPFPKIKSKLMGLHYDLVLMKAKPKEGLKAIVLSCACQVVFATTFYVTALALQQDIPMIYFLIFVPLICVAAAFPSLGGLGVREMGAAYLFGLVGVSSGVAVSLSLINFLFMVFVGLMGGVVYVATLSSGRIQHHSSDTGLGHCQTRNPT